MFRQSPECRAATQASEGGATALYIYYNPSLAGNSYLGGLQYALAGGGLLSPVPIPSTLILFVSGLLGLVAWGGGDGWHEGEGMILDNYVIRIYRRDRSDPRLIVGIVEEVDSRKKKGFNTFEELRAILASPAGRFVQQKYLRNRRKSTPEGI